MRLFVRITIAFAIRNLGGILILVRGFHPAARGTKICGIIQSPTARVPQRSKQLLMFSIPAVVRTEVIVETFNNFLTACMTDIGADAVIRVNKMLGRECNNFLG